MDLHAYLRLLRKQWKVIAGIATAVVVASVAVTLLVPRTYQSQLQFFVSTMDTSDNSQLAQGSTFLQQRVKSYAQLVTAPVVLQPVVTKARLDTTAEKLANDVAATIPPDTVLIDVSVDARTPGQAQRIARAVASEFPKTVANLEKVSKKKDSPVKVTVTKAPTFNPSPVSPRPFRNVAIGLVLGLLLGLGIAALRQMLDSRVRTKEDASLVAPDVPVLGAISFDDDALKHPLLRGDRVQSPRAEAFRTLRTNLAFVGGGTSNASRAIVLTSSLPGEGKTTTSANLALMLADSGASICLIEGDLRRPRLLEYFGMDGSAGLTDVLIGRAEIDDVVQPYGERTLWLIGAGQLPPNPSELLGSPAMRDTMERLAKSFDYVLIDAPPLLPVTDAAVLARQVDGAVMIVGSGLVTRDQLSTSLERLANVGGRVMGIVLNRVSRAETPGGYYGYGYEYSADNNAQSTASVSPPEGESFLDTLGRGESAKGDAVGASGSGQGDTSARW